MNSKKIQTEKDIAQLKVGELLATLGEDTGNVFGQISSLLALPDDQFALMKDHFLIEIQKDLNDPSQQMLLVQSFNSSGAKAEDLISMYGPICQEIDEELSGIVSNHKCEFLKQLIFNIINAVAQTEGIAKRIIIVPTERINNASLPIYAHLTDAGADLIALEDIELKPGEQKIIPTGLKVAIPLGYALLIQPRSGLSAKSKLRIANTPGLIDSGYRGEIGVILENIEAPIKDIQYKFNDDGTVSIISIEHGRTMTVSKGQKFAQMRLVEVPRAAYEEVEKIDEMASDRGAGGFGSTDTVKENVENKN